jgi:hypothetical protein
VGALGLGVKPGRADTDPLPDAAGFLVVVAAFLDTGGAAFLDGDDGDDFLVDSGGRAFFAAGAVFLAGDDFLVDDGAPCLRTGGAFLAADAFFFVAVLAFFTTGAAFFLGSATRLVAVAATLPEARLFPVRDELAESERDPDARLAWTPLLDGVIVPSFGPGQASVP